MTKSIDIYYAMISPFTYLGFARFREVARKHGAQVAFKPVALSKVFPATGGVPLPKRAPARQAYRLVELKRWSEVNGVPLNPQPAHFPADDTLAALMGVAAREQGQDIGDFSLAVLRAVWAEDRNIGDAATLEAIAGGVGLDGAALLAAAETEAVIARYDADTQEAIDRGVFGAPFMFYKDEPFWGQDRIELLDRALAD
ncbi:MAG: 2-hydroxychromene-2-carboxylate isomerase [Alphaproteobacteria bacterium]|nr:2-hydroxychromene-2-carboxylate isomerase [Alphaproteobacteria bacterium]